MWTWYLSSPGLSPSRANSISNSISVGRTARSQIVQSAPTPGPPHEVSRSVQQGRESKDRRSVRPFERPFPDPQEPIPGEHGEPQRPRHRVAQEGELLDVMRDTPFRGCPGREEDNVAGDDATFLARLGGDESL